jgi:MFS family permease
MAGVTTVSSLFWGMEQFPPKRPLGPVQYTRTSHSFILLGLVLGPFAGGLFVSWHGTNYVVPPASSCFFVFNLASSMTVTVTMTMDDPNPHTIYIPTFFRQELLSQTDLSEDYIHD